MLNKINMLIKFDDILDDDLNIGIFDIRSKPDLNKLHYNKEHFFQIKNVLFYMAYNTHVMHHSIDNLYGQPFYKITPWNCINVPNYLYVPYIGNLSNESVFIDQYNIGICFHKHLADLLHNRITIFSKNIYFVFEHMINKYLQELTTFYDMEFTIQEDLNVIHVILDNKDTTSLINMLKQITNNNIRNVVM